MAQRFVIIGGGPAGHTAATYAVRLGAEVTIVEQEVIGGAAHLRDCIPSKAMIATGGALAAVRRAPEMGLTEASVSV
ncbi:MAG TPA: FAD-dependent oxidoreductase, partial [Nitriliruptorales bacterium]